jgi:hypothetical protein
MASIATIRLAEMPLVLVNNFLAKANTFITGKPGMGKTHMIEEYATKMRERMPDFHMSRFYAPTMSPMDIMASAPDYEAGTLKIYVNEALPNAYATYDGKPGHELKGAVFFGELPNTDPATLKLLQKYINGEDISGRLRKPDGIVVIADGNRLEDKSGVQQQGRAFLSRFEQVEVFTSYEDNIAYAMKHAWHANVQTFFKDNPALVDNYDEVFGTKDAANKDAGKEKSDSTRSEEGKRGVWANMRAWERISAKEYAAESMGRKVTQAEIAGNIGTAAASQYEAHRTILSKLTSFEDIMANPDSVDVPKEMDQQYMLSMVIALRCKTEQMANVRKFAERLPLEMQAVVLRTMTTRKGFNLAATPDYLQWIKNKELTALLNGR